MSTELEISNGDVEMTEDVSPSRNTRRSLKQKLDEDVRASLRQLHDTFTNPITYTWINVITFAAMIGIWEYIPQALLAWSQSKKFELLDSLLSNHGLLFFTCMHVLLSIGLAVSATLLTLFVRLSAGGSGLPAIIVYVDSGNKSDQLFDPLCILVKTVGISLGITSGLLIGREGPAVHIGAGIGYLVTSYSSLYTS